MHCEWRLYRAFIMWCADVVGNQQVIEDPNVSVFNFHRFFFLDVLTRACAQYINFVAKLPGAEELGEPRSFLAKAEVNRDFAWVCHFAFDAGFFVLDFLQSVRANDSKTLDVLWREFFPSAHSGTANKTQYVPIAIMRVFWGQAMTADLDMLYHKLRTIPMSDQYNGSGVGWDMAIEMLNAAIKAHVNHFVSQAQIKHFVANWAMLECVQEHMRLLAYGPGASYARAHHVDAGPDVATLVDKFKSVIGTTWAQVTRPNIQSHVTSGPRCGRLPWREIAEVMRRAGHDAPDAYIRRYVSRLTPYFEWSA